MFKLLLSVFRRAATAITNPFRVVLLQLQRLFNVNILTAKLVAPFTKKVKSLITLKPQSKADYYVIGRHWVYKKLFLTVLLVICAAVFLYFNLFAPKLPAQPAQAEAVKTDVSYAYNDMKVREYTGTANITAADGQIIYTGDIKNGVCEGTGVLKDRQGRLLYEGEFKQNKYEGTGVLYYPSGNKKYEGSFAENVYQGDGTYYADDGTVLYAGAFQNGKYEGEGKAYSEKGVLLYEGEFSDGAYHGTGTSYYSDGIIRYEGEFFSGKEQGTGTLYNEEGKKLYTGPMQAGSINYRALVSANLQEIEDAFEETPRIFYSDLDSVFVFEQAGVVVTVDCRVKVNTWENQTQNKNEAYYYMPSEVPVYTSGSGSASGVSARPQSGAATQIMLLGSAQPQAQTVTALGAAAQNVPQVQQIGWYVEDSTAPGSPSGWTPPASSSSSASGDGASSSSGASGSASSDANSQQSASSDASSTAQVPDFIQKDITLYFEIDRNIWRSEAELISNNEKSKLQVSKITVFNQDQPILPEDAAEYDENVAAGIEDCVAIDYLRQTTPTAFSNVLFQMDKQNKLFVRVGAVSYADKIVCKARTQGKLTYRTYYQADDAKQLMYFSIEN